MIRAVPDLVPRVAALAERVARDQDFDIFRLEQFATDRPRESSRAIAPHVTGLGPVRRLVRRGTATHAMGPDRSEPEHDPASDQGDEPVTRVTGEVNDETPTTRRRILSVLPWVALGALGLFWLIELAMTAFGLAHGGAAHP